MSILNTAEQLRALDAAHHLQPFADKKALIEQGPHIITGAQGVHLTDSEGRQILDGMAGLWCTALGYGRSEIVEAVTKQMHELPYYNTFFQCTHPPVVELSRLLSEVTPPHINRFHFGSSGSDANDTILRMVTHYWALMGKPDRNVIVSRRGAYHGSTVAASALTGFGEMHAQPGLPVGNIYHGPRPHWWLEGGDLSPDEFGRKVALDTLALIDGIGVDRIAAFIAEPIMGAGGVIIPPETYWPTLAPGLKERGVLLICDEVICGFGRTGRWFGCETYGLEPDFMTMAKALTSGYVPLSAVGVADPIAEVLANGGEFFHGYTYAGHPVACAAAIANITILREEQVVERANSDIAPYLAERWGKLAEHPLVGEAVTKGMLGAIQLCRSKSPREAFHEDVGVGVKLRGHAYAGGLVMRAVADRMVVSPPLVFSRAHVDELIEKAHRALDLTLADLKADGTL